ncbi:DOPA-like domain-containing protein [Boletus coccyginus]|nr:DOPA-like domain-containing protein [Boletus coccyginus]
MSHPPESSLSPAYYEFPAPITSSSAGFDFHVYWISSSSGQTEHARQLYARIGREFPELPLGRFWDRPVGPHPTTMFQVNTLTPHQTGAFFGWLVVNRGPCDVLVHPNTGNAYRDHAELATWIGKPWPLYLDMLRRSS